MEEAKALGPEVPGWCVSVQTADPESGGHLYPTNDGPVPPTTRTNAELSIADLARYST